jgi:hypothetical protein
MIGVCCLLISTFPILFELLLIIFYLKKEVIVRLNQQITCLNKRYHHTVSAVDYLNLLNISDTDVILIKSPYN